MGINIRNFGVGKFRSPYKADPETTTTTDDKEEEGYKTKEQGGDSEKEDKGWVKALKAATTMASHGLASVYGGTAHTPKINWKKSEDAVNDEGDAPGIVDGILGDDAPDSDANPEPMSFANAEEGNQFRKWVNEKYPDYAKEIDLDASGSHTNSFISEAWDKHGKEFYAMKPNLDSPVDMVSPLKKRGKRGSHASVRGSKYARKATKKGRHGGFGKSKGVKGGGGRNIGGYNVQTRFSPRAAETTPSGGGGVSSGGTSQPYSYDKGGNMVFSPTINNIIGGGDQEQSQTQSQTQGMEWVPPEYGTRTVNGKLPTYREAWDNNNKDVQDKYDTFEDFEVAAKEWNAKHGGGGSGSYEERYMTKEGYYRPTGGTSTQTQTQTQTSIAKMRGGKFNIGGYRTMHGK